MQPLDSGAVDRGQARRERPAGVLAGAPLTRLHGPSSALGLVADDMGRAELRLRDLLTSDVRAVASVSRYLADAGGKRLRPALTALGARAVGVQGPIDDLMCVGELIHLGSLLHDDVVDLAETRRGRPAAHVLHGNAATVLTGDFCLARAVLLASESGGLQAVTALGHAVTAMAEGEVLQLQRAGDLGSTWAQYLEVVERKSAALIAWCAAAGAYLQGDHEAADALDRFGRAVGVAFQITDDVLDYAPGTGKAPGADLRERKVTLPLLYAMEALPELRPALEAGPPDPAAVAGWMERIRACGALERAIDTAHGFVADGLAGLDVLPASEHRDALELLARYLVDRAI